MIPSGRYTRSGSNSGPRSVRHAAPEPMDERTQTAAQKDDHDLVRRAQAGDEDAFASLVQRYQKKVWRVARQRVPSDEDAQDLAQEAFLRVFRNLERFDFKYPFTTWLYRIVTNLAIDHLRKRRPAQSIHGVDDQEADIDLEDHKGERPSDLMEATETADEIRSVLETLAPHFQSVLMLRELEGMACCDIADIVGATNVTVRWRLHRGRKLFQEAWERRDRRGDRSADSEADTAGGAAVDAP
jgi:RNA polymerase sigma-70 factor, ECF subfamily